MKAVSRFGRLGRTSVRVVLLSLAVSVTAAPGAADLQEFEDERFAIVSAQPCLTRRPAPEKVGMRLDCLPFGERVSRLRENGNWTLVRAHGGSVGWAASRYLQEIMAVEEPRSASIAKATACLTRRAVPDSRGMRLDCVPHGTRMNKLKDYSGWSLARTADGVIGWLAARFLAENRGELATGGTALPTATGLSTTPELPRVRRIYPAAEVRARPCLKRRSSLEKHAAALDCLPHGTVVELLGRLGEQTQVLTRDGRRGWVSSEYLAASGSVLLVTDADVAHVDPAQFVAVPDRVTEPAAATRGLEVTKWATSDESAEGLVIVGMIRNMGTQVSTAVTMNVKVYDYEEEVVLNQPATVDTTILMPGQATRFETTLEQIFAFRAVEFDTSSVDFDVVDSKIVVPST